VTPSAQLALQQSVQSPVCDGFPEPTHDDPPEELQLVPSPQSPAVSVGHVPSSHVHGVQAAPPDPLEELQLVPSAQSPAVSVGQVPSAHVHGEQLPPASSPPPPPAPLEELQLVPSAQSPAVSVGQVPSSHVHGEQLVTPPPLSHVTPSRHVPLQQSLQVPVWVGFPPTRQLPVPAAPASSAFPLAWQLLFRQLNCGWQQSVSKTHESS
jgi:hypothetical protein